MRHFLIVAALAGLTIAPARATEPVALSVEHYAPIPCSVACAHWDGPSAAGFDICNQPFPAGSFDISTFRITAASGLVTVSATSVIDYDTFGCTTTDPSILINPGFCGFPRKCSQVGDPCDGIAGDSSIAIGCTEEGSLNLATLHSFNGGANDEFRLISYNWSDYAPLPITITGPAEILDDTYEAEIVS